MDQFASALVLDRAEVGVIEPRIEPTQPGGQQSGSAKLPPARVVQLPEIPATEVLDSWNLETWTFAGTVMR